MSDSSRAEIPVLEYAPANKTLPIGRLTFYFGLVYFLQGICQYSGLIGPTIKNYLRVDMGFTAEQSANFGFWVSLPWMLKPIYGLISDFIPLFGYRRRSYLLLCNMGAACLFLWMSGVSNPNALMIATMMVGFSVAAADVIVDALMVEFGQKTGLVTRFQGVQWTSIYVAAMLSTIVGSYLIEWLSPLKAVSVSALICIVFPVLVLTATWWCVPEQKAKLNAEALRESAQGLATAFQSGRLWFVVAFVALLAFNAALQTPAYYYFTNERQLAPSVVTFADTYFCIGAVVASLMFLVLPMKKMGTRTLQTVGIVVSAVSMVPFCFAKEKYGLNVANGLWGFGYMAGSLATLSLAADACPKRAEGFVFASILAISNFVMGRSDVWGSAWYEGFAQKQLWLMVVISIGIKLIALPLVLFLPKHMRPASQKSEMGTLPVAEKV